MTNEQLALLLRQIADRLKLLSHDIENVITDGERELERVWVGEGEPPFLPTITNGKNWEFQPIGEFKAVSWVRDFADELETEAYNLCHSNGKDNETHSIPNGDDRAISQAQEV